jgi:hypothetical protein
VPEILDYRFGTEEPHHKALDEILDRATEFQLGQHGAELMQALGALRRATDAVSPKKGPALQDEHRALTTFKPYPAAAAAAKREICRYLELRELTATPASASVGGHDTVAVETLKQFVQTIVAACEKFRGDPSFENRDELEQQFEAFVEFFDRNRKSFDKQITKEIESGLGALTQALEQVDLKIDLADLEWRRNISRFIETMKGIR